MTLLSLDWAGLLGLFAAPAAVIIALYLLKEQRPVIVVPFVQLWNKVLSQERARQPWLRLRRFRSLLWQLAMLAALVLAFANPSFERWTGHPRRYIAVLDTSASMGAPSSNPTRWQTRLDEAVDIIRTESSELGGRDRAALVLAGAGVSVRATLGPVADLHEAIDAPLNTSGGASLKEAISIAIAMSAETPEQTWIRVFSDREAPLTFSKRCRATSLACTWTRLGSTSDNIALTAFAARRSHRTPELVDMSAEIHNFGGSPATVQLQIAAATLPLETVTVDLPADGSERVSLRGLEAPQEVFTAKIEPAEGSPALPGVAYDDIAYATVAPRSRLRIAKVSDRQNLFLDAVLLALDAEFELVSSSFAKVRADPTKLDEFDLVVVDASDDPDPLPLPDTTAIFFDPHRVPGRPFPLNIERRIRRPRISARPIGDPLVTGLVFKDVNIGTATTFELNDGDRPLLKHLDEPIAAVRIHDQGEWIVLGFDPARSDLPLRAAFPMLISRVVRRLQPPSENVAPQLLAGRTSAVSLHDLGIELDEGAAVDILDDAGATVARTAVLRGAMDITIQTPGVYRVVVAEEVVASLAVFGHGREESELRGPSASEERETDDGDAEARNASRPWRVGPLGRVPPYLALLLLTFASLLLEWRAFHQRRTL